MDTTFLTADQPTMPRQEFFRLIGTSIGTILLTRCISGCAGKAENDPTPNPSQKIDFVLQLNDKSNENLLTKGGYVIVNDIIVAQTKSGDFVAVSANCTHQGAQLVFKGADNQFYCPLHLSRFDTTGKVINGPASLPLLQYTVVTDSSAGILRIHN